MRKNAFTLNGEAVAQGETRDVRIKISESYTGQPIEMPVRVIRAARPGPKVFVTAAVHGNELNGTGIVHELMYAAPLPLSRGTLVLAPVVNVFGVEYQDRYMPDRRDLNRNFPGTADGSLTRRVAYMLFQQVIRQCDFGIDLHSAAEHRVNYPNIRGDLRISEVRRLASAFGCELIVNGKGPEGSLRREACKAGCPTIILEAGEPRRIEPNVLEIGCRGIRGVLVELGMLEGEPHLPAYQTRVDRTTWVRAQVGGILRFHVAPGAVIRRGEAIATNTSVFGHENNVLHSPVDGIILGMSTLPTVKPGEPVCHIAIPKVPIQQIISALDQRSRDSLHQRIQRDLAEGIQIVAPLKE